jgi:hypothetical protein
MTSVVFGLELLIKKIEFVRIETFPSLTLVVDTNPPFTLIPYSEEAKSGDAWSPMGVYQLIYVVDAFEKCMSCPISFELVSPFESTYLGQCPSEVKPLLCDAIAAHGSGPVVSQVSPLRDFERVQMGLMKFEMRIIFFKMCRKRAATERSQIRQLLQSEAARMLANQPRQPTQLRATPPDAKGSSSATD